MSLWGTISSFGSSIGSGISSGASYVGDSLGLTGGSGSYRPYGESAEVSDATAEAYQTFGQSGGTGGSSGGGFFDTVESASESVLGEDLTSSLEQGIETASGEISKGAGKVIANKGKEAVNNTVNQYDHSPSSGLEPLRKFTKDVSDAVTGPAVQSTLDQPIVKGAGISLRQGAIGLSALLGLLLLVQVD